MSRPPRPATIGVAVSATVLAGVLVALPPGSVPAAAAAIGTGLSPYYTMQVMAQTPDTGLLSMGGGVSLNDSGMVAFTGAVAAGEGVFVTNGSAPTNIAAGFLSPTRSFGEAAQINNDGYVLGRVRKQGNPSTYQLYRFEPGGAGNTQIATGGPSFSPVDIIGSYPALNNHNATAFAAQCMSRCLLDEALLTPKVEGSSSFADYNSTPMPSGALRPQLADTGEIVVMDTSKTEVTLFDYSLSKAEHIACASGCIHSGFTSLGPAPGIDGSGSVVAFVGDRGHGPGIFVSIRNAAGGRDLVPVTGERWDATKNTCSSPQNPQDIAGFIGLDDAGDPLCFKDFDLSSRIAVARLGQRIIVTFRATPSASSRPDPVTHRPLMFSAERGIFTMDIEIGKQPLPPGGPAFLPRGPMKVAQVGDTAAGRLIVDLSPLHDPLTIPSTDDQGTPRPPQPGDHRIAFRASTNAGDLVLRASHFDTDQDGLLDHWEQTGLDVDGDGSVDLDLRAMGADPNHQDLFLEIDWLADPVNPMNFPVSHKPEPGVRDSLEKMFAAHGVTLHLDAGPGTDRAGDRLSNIVNPTLLQGGDTIGLDGNPKIPPDVILFGPRAALPPRANGVSVRWFDDIKKTFFGGLENSAREFAFHYAVLGDSPAFVGENGGLTLARPGQPPVLAGQVDSGQGGATPSITMKGFALPGGAKLAGDVVKITGACPAAGQLRTIATNTSTELFVRSAWSVVPTNTCGFAVLSGRTGVAEEFISDSDSNSIPGNDLLVAFGGFSNRGFKVDAFLQWRTIAHELGHNLGLRHCGAAADETACTAASYQSLMNYAHQLNRKSAVQDYSTSTDPTFDDWAHQRFDLATAPIHLGNSFLRFFGAGDDVFDTEEATVAQYLDVNPGLDVTAPETTVTRPPEGAMVTLGSSMDVGLRAVDDVATTGVEVRFDVDGDGVPESVAATASEHGYRATFPPLTGPAGTRLVTALAEDAAGNLGFASVAVEVGASRATTTTVLGTSPAPSVTGQPVTVRYAVSAVSGSDTPPGNVTVSDGTTECHSTAATGECTLTPHGTGPHTFTASYGGDAHFDPSVSTPAVHQVNPAATTTQVLSAAPDPSDVGRAVTVAYEVTVNAPGAGTPSGTVTVSDGIDSCSGSVAQGGCAITVHTSGERTLTARYSGDDEFEPSTSPGLTHTVSPADTPPTASVVDGACGDQPHHPSATLRFTADDPDGDPVTVTVLSNSNPNVIPTAGTVLETRGTAHALTVTANANRSGGRAVIVLGLTAGSTTTRWPVTVTVGNTSAAITGTAGVDLLLAQNGSGTATGGDGGDLICGGNGDDTLVGGNGDDILLGGNGDDDLDGGPGNDILRGGRGDDRLAGGPGADLFDSGPGHNVSVDHSPAEGDRP